jgi:hypothetical protein
MPTSHGLMGTRPSKGTLDPCPVDEVVADPRIVYERLRHEVEPDQDEERPLSLRRPSRSGQWTRTGRKEPAAPRGRKDARGGRVLAPGDVRRLVQEDHAGGRGASARSSRKMHCSTPAFSGELRDLNPRRKRQYYMSTT